MACGRFGDIEFRFVRRQANAVGLLHGENGFHDVTAVGEGIKNARPVSFPWAIFPVVREPKPALRIENDVIGAFQPLAVAVGIQRLYRTRVEVYSLNTASGIACRLFARVHLAVTLDPFKAAVVTDVTLAIRADRCSVGASA